MDYYDDTVNHYKVLKATWMEWDDDTRRKFNRIYSAMTRNPDIFPGDKDWQKRVKQFALESVG